MARRSSMYFGALLVALAMVSAARAGALAPIRAAPALPSCSLAPAALLIACSAPTPAPAAPHLQVQPASGLGMLGGVWSALRSLAAAPPPPPPPPREVPLPYSLQVRRRCRTQCTRHVQQGALAAAQEGTSQARARARARLAGAWPWQLPLRHAALGFKHLVKPLPPGAYL